MESLAEFTKERQRKSKKPAYLHRLWASTMLCSEQLYTCRHELTICPASFPHQSNDQDRSMMRSYAGDYQHNASPAQEAS